MNDSDLLKEEILKPGENSDAELSRLQTELEAARQQISLLEEELKTKQLKGMHRKILIQHIHGCMQ